MCILFKLDITLEAVALLGLRSARVVILIWEHIAPSEGVVYTIPYSYTQHIAPREREGTYSYLEGCAPYSTHTHGRGTPSLPDMAAPSLITAFTPKPSSDKRHRREGFLEAT